MAEPVSRVESGDIDRGVWTYDLETLISLFCAVFINVDTKEQRVFIIHESRNDVQELRQFIKQCKGLIGFNNLNFDYPILHLIIKSKETNINKLIKAIYDKAQSIVNEDSKPMWESDILIRQLDLYKIWHFNNRAKSASLKWIQYSTDWFNIEDMPINHDEYISEDQIPFIINYCINDVLSTIKLYEYTIGQTEDPLYKGIDKVQLRKDIRSEFNLPCINWNDVKIGDELVKKDYIQRAQIEKTDLKFIKTNLKPVFTYQECFPNYWKFQTKEFNNFINSFKDKIVDIGSKEEFEFRYNQTSYTFAQGGLHSNDGRRIIIPKENEYLRDADVGLNWPN